jgi:hypothetical protein
MYGWVLALAQQGAHPRCLSVSRVSTHGLLHYEQVGSCASAAPHN